MRNFYLLSANNKTEKGTVLNIPTENGIENTFTDIAYLDIATLKIDKDKSFEILKEYNPKVDINSLYIIPDKQKENSLSVYYPLFNFNDQKSKYFLDMLEYYANKRIQNIEATGKIGKFDFRKDNNLLNLIKSTLIGITRLKPMEFDRLTDRNSIMVGFLKDKLYDSNMKDDIDINNPITRKAHEIGSVLNNYASLRNFIYAYLLVLEKYDVSLNSRLRKAALYKNDITKDDDIGPTGTQMELFDFNKDIPKVKEK